MDLDKLDLAILRELVRESVMPFAGLTLRRSFRSIAKDLGVDQGTIRNRLKKLQNSGLVKGWYLGVNPTLFGDRLATFWFSVRPPSKKSNVIREVSRMKGLILLCDRLGAGLNGAFCYDSPSTLRKNSKWMEKISNSDDMECEDKRILECKSVLSPTDWAIIMNLQKDPWKSYSSVARELELSTKTVKRRIAGLVEDGAIYLLVKIDLKSMEGRIPADFTVFYDGKTSREETDRRIRDGLGENLFFADLQDPKFGYYALHIPNVKLAEEIRKWITSVIGVARVDVEVLLEVRAFDSYYLERVEEMAPKEVRPIARER